MHSKKGKCSPARWCKKVIISAPAKMKKHLHSSWESTIPVIRKICPLCPMLPARPTVWHLSVKYWKTIMELNMVLVHDPRCNCQKVVTAVLSGLTFCIRQSDSIHYPEPLRLSSRHSFSERQDEWYFLSCSNYRRLKNVALKVCIL